MYREESRGYSPGKWGSVCVVRDGYQMTYEVVLLGQILTDEQQGYITNVASGSDSGKCSFYVRIQVTLFPYPIPVGGTERLNGTIATPLITRVTPLRSLRIFKPCRLPEARCNPELGSCSRARLRRSCPQTHSSILLFPDPVHLLFLFCHLRKFGLMGDGKRIISPKHRVCRRNVSQIRGK